MHHHKTYMCINFQHNRVETQVVTVLTSLLVKKLQEDTCISIFIKLGLIDQSMTMTMTMNMIY